MRSRRRFIVHDEQTSFVSTLSRPLLANTMTSILMLKLKSSFFLCIFVQSLKGFPVRWVVLAHDSNARRTRVAALRCMHTNSRLPDKHARRKHRKGDSSFTLCDPGCLANPIEIDIIFS